MNVLIEQDVEIGANTTVDRATVGSTVIRKGVKIDNLVQIAHNVEIGENTVIAAQSGISGSCKIGRNCVLGGQVGVADHITIADEVRIAAQSGIAKNISEKGATVQGSPAFNHYNFKRSYVHFIKLPQLIKELEKDNKMVSLEQIAREPVFASQEKMVSGLLKEMKGRKTHMAIVIDEHGGVEGLVTLEDLIEEIVSLSTL